MSNLCFVRSRILLLDGGLWLWFLKVEAGFASELEGALEVVGHDLLVLIAGLVDA